MVEVLSPKSRGTDYREKATVYTAAGAFRIYLLADPEKRQIDACTRGEDGLARETHTSGHVAPELALDVDELYDTLNETALT